mmetsp:Transcript_53799/g.149233  ORF Transcript_53799/g.149233 Transcript_53799/m.149233 type:complete len:201 (+) Transcript_53799:138-740(+)
MTLACESAPPQTVDRSLERSHAVDSSAECGSRSSSAESRQSSAPFGTSRAWQEAEEGLAPDNDRPVMQWPTGGSVTTSSSSSSSSQLTGALLSAMGGIGNGAPRSRTAPSSRKSALLGGGQSSPSSVASVTEGLKGGAGHCVGDQPVIVQGVSHGQGGPARTSWCSIGWAWPGSSAAVGTCSQGGHDFASVVGPRNIVSL